MDFEEALPLRATMFHAMGLNAMDKSEMYSDVADVSTMASMTDERKNKQRNASKMLPTRDSHGDLPLTSWQV